MVLFRKADLKAINIVCPTSGEAERSGKSIWLKVSGYRREQPLLVPPAPGILRSQAWAIRRAALELWKKQPALLHMV